MSRDTRKAESVSLIKETKVDKILDSLLVGLRS